MDLWLGSRHPPFPDAGGGGDSAEIENVANSHSFVLLQEALPGRQDLVGFAAGGRTQIFDLNAEARGRK